MIQESSSGSSRLMMANHQSRRYNEFMFDKCMKLDQPAVFLIRLQTEIDLEWGEWFEHMTVTVSGGVTTLTGPVADQSALHSLLVKIRDLGLPLIYLERIDNLSGRDTNGG